MKAKTAMVAIHANRLHSGVSKTECSAYGLPQYITVNTTAKITAHTVSGSQHFSRRSITSSWDKTKYSTKNPAP